MNLGRIGHYHIPDKDGAGTCQTSIVVKVFEAGHAVNLVTFTHEGNHVYHGGVLVASPEATERSADSAEFHLCGECPYGR